MRASAQRPRRCIAVLRSDRARCAIMTKASLGSHFCAKPRAAWP